MNLTGMVYRPPYEANSLLLQVTLGCSHNKCTFCYMYPDVKFTVCPMEQIEADIEEAARVCPDVERVFLEHGDAFVLSADRLTQIAEAIHRKLPKVKTIAMYASIQNIKHKTDTELRRLCDLGIGGLDVGVESGLDAALSYMNKGHTAAEAKEQLLRLTKAGITYSFNAILGCGGADLWRENADATADLINAVQPHLLFIGSLHAQPGCRLYNDIAEIHGCADKLKRIAMDEAQQQAEETAQEIDAEHKERLSPFRFSMCSIQPGEGIEYCNNPEIKCTVVDDKTVSYDRPKKFPARIATEGNNRYNSFKGVDGNDRTGKI